MLFRFRSAPSFAVCKPAPIVSLLFMKASQNVSQTIIHVRRPLIYQMKLSQTFFKRKIKSMNAFADHHSGKQVINGIRCAGDVHKCRPRHFFLWNRVFSCNSVVPGIYFLTDKYLSSQLGFGNHHHTNYVVSEIECYHK